MSKMGEELLRGLLLGGGPSVVSYSRCRLAAIGEVIGLHRWSGTFGKSHFKGPWHPLFARDNDSLIHDAKLCTMLLCDSEAVKTCTSVYLLGILTLQHLLSICIW
jgi:hypothetical protein